MADSQLQRLVEVMDRLRSPGGCPWDAEQTHESLIKYLLEESYEFIDAIETDDRAGMREELGDVLLQVYFHSRIAQDHPTDPFSIEDVEVSGTDEIIENWEAIKAREKGRTSAIDGIAMAQPALPLVAKILYRAEKYNVDLHVDQYSSEKATEKSVGEALASVIAWAHENGIDPENALRAQAREMIRQIQAAEQQGK